MEKKSLILTVFPMAVGPSHIYGNDWLGPIDSFPAADRMSDEIFGANLVFWAEI